MSAASLAVPLGKYPWRWHSKNDMVWFKRPHILSQHSSLKSRTFVAERKKMFLFGASRSLALYCCTYHAYRIVIRYPRIWRYIAVRLILTALWYNTLVYTRYLVPNTGTCRRLCPFENRTRRNPLFVWTRISLGLLFHALVGVHHTVVGGNHFFVHWRSEVSPHVGM